ncbi:HNH endonuclease [Shimazuella kribbensis]|uniref:HNH endonuclease n=1 Tax=Shimazuella kribbensis TaxID=139808 RepID=UPI00316AD56F
MECERNGRVVPATVVDHITPHKGDRELFWDSTNWQSMCSTCHNRKTVWFDGIFRNISK